MNNQAFPKPRGNIECIIALRCFDKNIRIKDKK